MQEPIERNQGEVIKVPDWYRKYSDRISVTGKDLLQEVKEVSEMNYELLNAHLGGNVDELPYEILQTLFITGTDDDKVAEILRGKRERYLLNHPEMRKSDPRAGMGIITYDGRFIPQKDWETATDSEKRAAMVGSTCFHFNSETPGMGSSPNDRW